MNLKSLAARTGAWSAQHRRRAILGWLLAVAVIAALGGAIGTRIDKHEGSGESGRVDAALRAHFPDSSSETILIQSRQAPLAASPDFRPALRELLARDAAVPHVTRLHADGVLSRDGRSTLLTLQLGHRGSIDRLLAQTAAVSRAHPALRIEEFGDASASRALDRSLGRDFSRAETLSIPITLAILVAAFGALVAAGLPMLLGLSAVGAALGLVAMVSQALPMDSAISSVVLLIGLAVGVDYSLFYLRREREERATGQAPAAALRAAAGTSGHAIALSGLTVMIAMAGMFFAGSRVFASFAVGTIIVVAVAMLGSLTVLPAMLAALGERVERGRVPGLARLRRRGVGGSRAWSAILHGVTARPRLATALSGLALLALTVPVLGMHTAVPGGSSLPRSLPIVRTYDRIQAAFPGGPMPAVVGVQAADVRAAPVREAAARLLRRAAQTPGLGHPVTIDVSADRRAETISIPLAGSGTDSRSDAALSRLRALVPATLGAVPGVQAGVTGETAGSADFNATMDSHLPLVFAFVLGMAFLLLLVTFRSLVIPLQAIALNLLSVGAAYGVLVLVFQHGIGHGLLGFQGTSPITSWLPLFLFVVLFGLSMDYHVFILTRVREAREAGLPAREATVTGVGRTAGAVTSAALVMVAVFSVFATLDMLEFKQMGVGLAAAILIDATVIRGVLLPATLTLLGDRAWWLPGWLQRLFDNRRTFSAWISRWRAVRRASGSRASAPSSGSAAR